jgi:hypothetical protein
MELVHEFRSYSVTIGFDVERNAIGEVFTHGAKVGSAMDAILDDACVTLPYCCNMVSNPQRSPPAWAGLGTERRLLQSLETLLTFSQGRRSNEFHAERIRR